MATDFRKRYRPLGENEAPYKQSRAALRERFGARSIDASAPLSAQNSMGGMTGLEPRDPRTGFTPDASWNSFFQRRMPPTGISAVPIGGTASMMSGISPAGARNDINAGGIMGTASHQFQMAGAPPAGGPVTAPMTAPKMWQSGIQGGEQYLDKMGLPRPSFEVIPPTVRPEADMLSQLFPLGSTEDDGDKSIREFFKRRSGIRT